jgi:release factor glutamine methyltransferase
VGGQNLADIMRGGEIKNKEEILELAQKRVKTGLPIQRLIGFSYFMGEKFIVNENVLIPRDETELLVRHVFELVQDVEAPSILDIGTGTGCIACMLGKILPQQDLEILAVDISTPALLTAIENAKNLLEPKRVLIRKSDVFSNIKEKFDVIVSNPPYIAPDTELQKEVQHEPETALFAADNGLYFYKKIINQARDFLNPNGRIAFELGMGQADNVKEMFLKNGYCDIKIIKDLAGIERVISAKC